MIRLENISRTFFVGGRPVHALRKVSFSIAEGEYVTIMGASGSGKSTLLNILGCLDRPNAGRYFLDGREVGGMKDEELAAVRGHKIGFVFQAFHLVPRLTALENVELPMVFAGAERGARRRAAQKALETVGLADRAEHRPNQLSGGERQRVAIARSIVMKPAILLADEPTGNLDSRTGLEVIALLEKLNTSGMTLVIVTHDPKLGSRAPHLIRLSDGRVIEDVFPKGAVTAKRSINRAGERADENVAD
ncbi:MAG: ABC transporter ATP-binding protein [Candidatus Hydrogenedentota bacterium]|nr:MAG: ABC transporter ATP-binding protein [Candidatus Hydrogenedentota bacterium]